MKKSIYALTGCLSLLSVTATLAAGTINGHLNVKLVLGSGCTVTGGDNSGVSNDFGTLDFGEHATLDNSITAQSSGSTGNVTLNCTKDLPYSIALDGGNHFSSSTRHMSNGSAEVAYSLYQDSARNTPWAMATPLALSGTGTDDSLTIYGRIPVQTNQAAGAYTDLVNVTVSW